MAVVVILGTNILHLVDAAALGASLHRSLTRHLSGEAGVSHDTSSYGQSTCYGISDALSLVKETARGSTYSEPVNDVRVSRDAGAASILLITSGLDHNRVVDGS